MVPFLNFHSDVMKWPSHQFTQLEWRLNHTECYFGVSFCVFYVATHLLLAAAADSFKPVLIYALADVSFLALTGDSRV